MSETKELYRILNKGGVLSPALLYKILLVAEKAGNKHVHFGSRQDILFYLPTNFKTEQLNRSGVSIHKRTSGVQNLVSSYSCVDILPSTSWIYSGIYLKIIDQFTYDHVLRINIVDPKQNMVPLFYGNLNFVASETPNYWHLYLSLNPNKDPQVWPGLIFTDDIATFAQALEQLIIRDKLETVEALLYALENSPLQKITLENTKKIDLPIGFFPYYEGLNKIDGKDQYWAGFYWRNNNYPIQFLKEVCQLCQRTNVVKISFTPWKTLLIKDIETKDKIHWEELIGRFGINMRHSSFELNWHLPLLDENAFKLKRYLVSAFDKLDIRTYGLSFGIQTQPGEKFTSVVIRIKGRLSFLGKYDFTRKYSIEYAYDFNPNNNHYLEYAGNLSKDELPEKLNDISKKYYAQSFVQSQTRHLNRQESPRRTYKIVHQCPECRTVYDERYGDLLTNIEAGTTFYELPDHYGCPVCETPKTAFSELEITELAS
ncbi:rubredoxin [Sunxiuqinia indica]|uniref:rubredoxin n=1 Tax=Sunxiuqinia indica TaxID=2692584 RepID=UPI00135A6D69|nr:rubredoxin [Sunxiuqinia indica]